MRDAIGQNTLRIVKKMCTEEGPSSSAEDSEIASGDGVRWWTTIGKIVLCH